MAKKNKQQKKKVMRRKPVQAISRGLDASAAAYAQLLADPCSAHLVNPVYAGGDAGYVTRYELDFTLDAVWTNAQSFGALLFTPGIIGASGGDTATGAGNNSLMALAPTGDPANSITDTNILGWRCRDPSTTQPGRTALAFLSSSVRTVAACMQVYYTGTELNRKGTMSMGKVNAGSILGQDSASVGGLRQVSQEVFRTPDTLVEFKWTPSDGDQLFTDPSLISLQRESERKSGILFTFAGVPTADIRVRLIAVYEWQPAPGQGVVNPSMNRNRSVNTLDHVLNYLDRNGPWMFSAARSAYQAVMSYRTGPTGRIAY